MATVLDDGPRIARKPLAADGFERLLSVGAVALLLVVTVAIMRGHAQWHRLPAAIWFHLATIMVALALTPVILLGRRGDARHRLLGRIWLAALLLTALASFFIRQVNDGGFSLIHLLSVWTLVQVPLIWWTARTHDHARHRAAVRGMVTGALLVAGFFTFPFGRMLGMWLAG